MFEPQGSTYQKVCGTKHLLFLNQIFCQVCLWYPRLSPTLLKQRTDLKKAKIYRGLKMQGIQETLQAQSRNAFLLTGRRSGFLRDLGSKEILALTNLLNANTFKSMGLKAEEIVSGLSNGDYRREACDSCDHGSLQAYRARMFYQASFSSGQTIQYSPQISSFLHSRLARNLWQQKNILNKSTAFLNICIFLHPLAFVPFSQPGHSASIDSSKG